MSRPAVVTSVDTALFGCVWLDLGYRPDWIADLEAGKAAYAEVFAQLADLLRDQVLDGERLIFDERLIKQANLFIKLAHLAFHDLLDHLGRFSRGRGLGPVNILLPLQVLGGHVLTPNVPWVGGRDVHGDVLEQLLEILRAGDEIALAIDFNQHTDLAPGMNVGANGPFAGTPRSLLGCRCHSPLAQDHNRLFQIALGFLERVAAIHHRRAGLFPELLDLSGRDIFSHTRHPRAIPLLAC